MGTLTIIRGVSGSGKTTKANAMMDAGIVDVIHEANDYFYHNGEYQFEHWKLAQAHRECQDNVWRSLNRGLNVVVANTSSTWAEVSTYLVMASTLDVAVDIIDMKHRFINIHMVPSEIVDAMEARFMNKADVLRVHERRFGKPFLGSYQVIG